MGEFDILKKQVGIASCSITSLNMRTGTIQQKESDDFQIDLDSKFRCVNLDEMPCGIDADIAIRANDGEAFSLDMTIRVIFAFDHEVSRESVELYLAKVAPTRAMDAARSYIGMITSASPFPILTIPPITVEVDPAEWHSA